MKQTQTFQKNQRVLLSAAARDRMTSVLPDDTYRYQDLGTVLFQEGNYVRVKVCSKTFTFKADELHGCKSFVINDLPPSMPLAIYEG